MAARRHQSRANNFDVFVSYARQDNQSRGEKRKGRVSEIVDVVTRFMKERLGRPSVFYDVSNLSSATDLVPATLNALEKSRCLLVFLSPAAIESQWCRKGWEFWQERIDAGRAMESSVFIVWLDEPGGWSERIPPFLAVRNGFQFWEKREVKSRPNSRENLNEGAIRLAEELAREIEKQRSIEDQQLRERSLEVQLRAELSEILRRQLDAATLSPTAGTMWSEIRSFVAPLFGAVRQAPDDARAKDHHYLVRAPRFFMDLQSTGRSPWGRSQREVRLSDVLSTPLLLLLGKPGMGKTSFLQFLAVQQWSAWSGVDKRDAELPDVWSTDVLPFAISCQALSEFLLRKASLGVRGAPRTFHAAEWLVRFCLSFTTAWTKEVREYFERVLRSEPIVFLLDGLDEVSEPTGRTRLAAVLGSVADHFPHWRVLVCGRKLDGFEPSDWPGFARAEMAPWDDDGVELLVRQILAPRPTPVHADAAAREVERILATLRSRRDLARTARNPALLLALLAARDGSSWPANKHELYDSVKAVIVHAIAATQDPIARQRAFGLLQELADALEYTPERPTLRTTSRQAFPGDVPTIRLGGNGQSDSVGTPGSDVVVRSSIDDGEAADFAQAVQEVADLARTAPVAYRLALGLSLATKIEPGLIRRHRLEVAPQYFGHEFPVVCESFLWFGPWVATRDSAGFRFQPSFAAALRERLIDLAAFDGDGQRALDHVAAVRDLIVRQHAGLHSAIRLEEELLYLLVRHRTAPEKLERELERAIVPALQAVVQPDREGLDRWLEAMCERLPRQAKSTLPIRLLAGAARTRIARSRQGVSQSPQISPALHISQSTVDFRGVGRRVLDVRQTGRVLQIGFLADGGQDVIEVPDLAPVRLQVNYFHRREATGAYEGVPDDVVVPIWEGRSELLEVPPAGFIEVPATWDVEVRTADGRSYRLGTLAPRRRHRRVRPHSHDLTAELVVDLSNRALTEIPEDILARRSIQRLILRGNQLTQLDPGLRELTNLIHLDVSENRLRELPTWLWQLPRLETLVACNNEIASLSEAITTARRLKSLDLRNNKLTKKNLPSELGELSELTDLLLDGNPIRHIPADVVADGQRTASWLRDQAAPRRKNKRFKLIVMGPREAWTDRSCHALWQQGEKLAEHDVQDPAWLFPLQVRPPELRGDHLTIELQRWDLRGVLSTCPRLDLLVSDAPLVLLFASQLDVSLLLQVWWNSPNARVIVAADTPGRGNIDEGLEWLKSGIQNPEQSGQNMSRTTIVDASDSQQLHAALAAAAATVISVSFNKLWSSRVFDAAERVVVEGLPAVGSLQFRGSPDDYARSMRLTLGEFDEFRELLQQQGQLLVLPPISPQAYGDDFDRARYVYAPQTALGWISLLADRRNVDFPGDVWLGPTRYSIAWNDVRSSDRDLLLIVADLLGVIAIPPLQSADSMTREVANSRVALLPHTLLESFPEPVKPKGTDELPSVCRLRVEIRSPLRVPDLGRWIARWPAQIGESMSARWARFVELDPSGDPVHAVIVELTRYIVDTSEFDDQAPARRQSVLLTAQGDGCHAMLDRFHQGTHVILRSGYGVDGETFVACPEFARASLCQGEFRLTELEAAWRESDESVVRCPSCHQSYRVADLLSHVSPVADQLVLKATQDRLCESPMRVFATFVGSASLHAARALDLLFEGLRQENFEVAYVITEASLNMPRAWPASPEDLSENDPVGLAEAAIVFVDHEIAETLEQIPVVQRIAARKKRDGLPLLIVRVDPVKSQFSESTSFGVDGWEPAGSWLPPNFVDSAESASARTQALMTAMEPVLAWLRRLRSEPLSESTPSWPTR